MEEIQMGKGDLRTRRGKIYNGSHGKKRPGRPARKTAPPAPAAPARGGRR
jgi:30S ribosomal protein S31